jgi:uncharacterized protein YggE
VSVTGISEVEVVPDEAVVQLGVETVAPDAVQAKSGNNRSIQAVLRLTKKLGIEDKYVQTSSLSIQQEYEYPGNNKPRRSTGFRVSNHMTILLKDLSKIDQLLDEAVKAGANSVEGVQFQSSRLKDIQSDARKAAVLDARAKAQALCGALGVKVGRPLTITENQDGYQPPRPMMALRAMAVSPDSGGPAVSAGQIKISQNVSVVFELE